MCCDAIKVTENYSLCHICFLFFYKRPHGLVMSKQDYQALSILSLLSQLPSFLFHSTFFLDFLFPLHFYVLLFYYPSLALHIKKKIMFKLKKDIFLKQSLKNVVLTFYSLTHVLQLEFIQLLQNSNQEMFNVTDLMFLIIRANKRWLSRQ